MDAATITALLTGVGAILGTVVGAGTMKILNAVKLNDRKDFTVVANGLREDVIKYREETAVERDRHQGCMERLMRMERDFGALEGAIGRLQDQNQVAFIQSDINGRIISWNGGATVLFGYSSDEATNGMNVATLIPERLRHQHEVAMKKKVAEIRSGNRGSDKVVELRDSHALKKNGTEFNATIHLSHCMAGSEILLSAEIRQR